jgi:hypothetical protein
MTERDEANAQSIATNVDGDTNVGQQHAMSHIQGWGADLDEKNRPAYPMERKPPRLEGVHWHEPEQQQSTVKVFHSTERPGITPIFGTSVPPTGLSGKLRTWAYGFSENNILRWLILMFADRVNVVEGVGEDIRHGHFPNVPSEMGLRAELRYNAAGFAKKVVVTAAVVGVVAYLCKRRK